MAKPTLVCALDIATTLGWAKGCVGLAPTFGSVRFGQPDASDNAVFFHAVRWANAFLAEEPKPQVIVLERMLTPQAFEGRTQTRTYERLAGLHGVIRSFAFGHGIYIIDTMPVTNVRSHFIGRSNAPSARAKELVMQQCRKLGWNPANDDEGDALALWHAYCSRLEPKLAIQVSPLFGLRGVAI